MSTPPPDEESDEDTIMLRNLAKATNKYEAAIAIQPANNHNPNTSANQTDGRDQDEGEDGSDSNNIEDRDIDNLKKLRINRQSHTQKRGDCIDDFITYHVTPGLQRRPTYEECLHDHDEDDPLQLNAAMIQPTISETEKEDGFPPLMGRFVASAQKNWRANGYRVYFYLPPPLSQKMSRCCRQNWAKGGGGKFAHARHTSMFHTTAHGNQERLEGGICVW